MMKSGSWIIVNRETGIGVLETFNEELTKLVNQDKYKVMTAYQYLTDLNRKIKAEKAQPASRA